MVWGFLTYVTLQVLPSAFCTCACGYVAACADKWAKPVPFGAQRMRSHESRPSFSRPLALCPAIVLRQPSPFQFPKLPPAPPCSCRGQGLGRWWHRSGAPLAGRLLGHRLPSDTGKAGSVPACFSWLITFRLNVLGNVASRGLGLE